MMFTYTIPPRVGNCRETGTLFEAFFEITIQNQIRVVTPQSAPNNTKFSHAVRKRKMRRC